MTDEIVRRAAGFRGSAFEGEHDGRIGEKQHLHRAHRGLFQRGTRHRAHRRAGRVCPRGRPGGAVPRSGDEGAQKRRLRQGDRAA